MNGNFIHGHGVMFNKIKMKKENSDFLIELSEKYFLFDYTLDSHSPYFLWLESERLENTNNTRKPLIMTKETLELLNNINNSNISKLSSECLYIYLGNCDPEELKYGLIGHIKKTLYRLVDNDYKARLEDVEMKKLINLIINEKNTLCGEFLVYLVS